MTDQTRSWGGAPAANPGASPPPSLPGETPLSDGRGMQWVPVAPTQGYWQMGAPPPAPQHHPWHRQGWFWLIVTLVGLIMIAFLGIAIVGAIHGLTAATQAQAAVLARQTQAQRSIAAALQGISQTLRAIGQTLAAISRELAQLVGQLSASAGGSGSHG